MPGGEKTYDEKAQEVQEAPDEGAGWEGESDAGETETEPAAK